MKTKSTLSLIVLFVSFTVSYAQDCNCETNYEWVKKTFEENDAGFKYVLETKGKSAYESHNAAILEQVKKINSISECTQILYKWMEFFRSGHIAIRLKAKDSKPTTVEAPKNYDDWETLEVNHIQFESELKKKKAADFEGIWETKPYRIGIKKVGENYIGFIIESDAPEWKKGQIKIKIFTENKSLKAKFYLRDHSEELANSVELIGKNYLKIGRFTLKRIAPVFTENSNIEDYFTNLNSSKPYSRQINSTTVLIRIPSFDQSYKKAIDSVISISKPMLAKTENLILDLRNNGGGSDGSFSEIIPLIYTNPIRSIGVEFLSTKLNNQRMLDFINNPEYEFDDEEKKWAQESYDKLNMKLGEFVNLRDGIVSEKKLDSIALFPKNVGILINENCGSTTEQFLLAAKQSKKVKLFGTTTAGVLDISNMYFVESPCKEFTLGYCLSRSMRIPEMTIDEKGIQPDFYIDKSIPHYDWIDYVSKVLNEK